MNYHHHDLGMKFKAPQTHSRYSTAWFSERLTVDRVDASGRADSTFKHAYGHGWVTRGLTVVVSIAVGTLYHNASFCELHHAFTAAALHSG